MTAYYITPAVGALVKDCLPFISGSQLFRIEVHANMLAFRALNMIVLHKVNFVTRLYNYAATHTNARTCCQ
jgi:hypothetical protein